MTKGPSLSARLSVLVGCVLAIAASAPLARAQQASTNYVLTVSTERTNALYHKGESVTFNIRLLLDNRPVSDAEVQWKITNDGMPPTQNGKVKLVDGSGSVSGNLDKPGFLQCSVTWQTPAGTKQTAV